MSTPTPQSLRSMAPRFTVATTWTTHSRFLAEYHHNRRVRYALVLLPRAWRVCIHSRLRANPLDHAASPTSGYENFAEDGPTTAPGDLLRTMRYRQRHRGSRNHYPRAQASSAYFDANNHCRQPDSFRADADHYHHRFRLRFAICVHRQLELHLSRRHERYAVVRRENRRWRDAGHLVLDRLADCACRPVRKLRDDALHTAGRSAYRQRMERPIRKWPVGLPSCCEWRNR
jgi:hypothetical protein